MAAIAARPLRVRVFIDFWNFSLSLRRSQADFKLDWAKVSSVLTAEVGKIMPGNSVAFEAMHVVGSYDPNKPNDARFKNWFTTWLDRQPGVHTVLLERQKKNYPKCPHCQKEMKTCECGGDMRGTEEKGVDTRIVTDMISLAWSNGYDVAVLVSSDKDFVPVAEFLQAKGIKVVHAAFPPDGALLSQKCWASFSIPAVMKQIEMSPPPPALVVAVAAPAN